MAYLVPDPDEDAEELYDYVDDLRSRLQEKGSGLVRDLAEAQAIVDEAERMLLASASTG